MAARRVVTGLSVAVLALLGWLLLAPQQLGGPVAVVTTYGDSMLPTYTASDLVVVAKADDYDVGDVVAYRSAQLGAVVLHRIVDGDEAGYVTSGDNNDWLDPDRPTDDQIMGTARLHVPGAGQLLEIPAPVRAAGGSALALGALAGGRAVTHRRMRRPARSTPSVELLPAARRRRSARRPRRQEGDVKRRPEFAWVGWPSPVGLGAGVLALLSLVLAAVAFTQPATAPGALDYQHRGEFAYASDAPSGLVYSDGQVTTGDPVFLRLVDSLEFSFDYAFDGPGDVETTGQLWMEVADGSGWSRRSLLVEQSEGADGGLLLEGQLDVPRLRRMLQRVQEQTGVGGSSVTITVTAEVEVTGTVGDEPVTDRFAPELAMQLNEHRLTLEDGAAGADDSPPADDDTEGTDKDVGVVRTQPGSVTVAGAEPSRLELAERGLDVSTARPLAVALFVLALLALVAACIGAARQGTLDEAGRVRARYGGRLLVEIESMEMPAGYGIVDVRDIETLVSLADRVDRPVLHQQSGSTHTYLVEGDATVYRHRLQTSRSDSDPAAAST